MIAGHSFDASGRCTGNVVRDDGTSYVCGRKLIDILQCDETYINERGWAHIGGLTHTEAMQIVTERARVSRVAHEATMEASA